MVSLWPWKGAGLSPAEFEKTLSTLASKIANTQAQLERVRISSRRVKFLLTLYLAFAYVIAAIVLILVVGWRSLGALEWSGMAGSPVIIYAARAATTAYYGFRVDTLESRLKDWNAERTKTIQKLKDATKYDSTLQLLEKYGGSGDKRNKEDKPSHPNEGSPAPGNDRSKRKQRSVDITNLVSRTNLAPPSTANIQRPSTSQGLPPHPQDRAAGSKSPQNQPTPQAQPMEEFAPNAGPVPNPNHYEMNPGPPRWYDRILDLMLGDDETAPKNRIVLICAECRLVNGQAPPGVKNLAELGTWKCMACGFANREINEGQKIMEQVLGGKPSTSRNGSVSEDKDSDRSSDVVKVELEDGEHSQSDSTSGKSMPDSKTKRAVKK